jgi:ATP-binding cassette subfamily B protein
MIKNFTHYKQLDQKDCGPTCLKIIARHYQQSINIQRLRILSETIRTGSNLQGVSNAAEAIGFRSLGVKINARKLEETPLPCILHWNGNHYVVLYKVSPSKKFPSLWEGLGMGLNSTYHISDPAHGLLTYKEREFLDLWIGKDASRETEEGIALLLEPTPALYEQENAGDEKKEFGFSILSRYVFKYKKYLWQLVLGLIAASILQLIFPFLTQSIVDIGIKNQDVPFIYLVLFAQLALFIGRTAIQVVRSWILLHISTRINISLVSDFFIKLMKLPIAFFDSRVTGDILQRINDHRRVERILTTSSLDVLFSMVNLVVFSIVLLYYNLSIFGVFALGSVLYFLWIVIFLKKRKDLDYKRFAQVSQEQSKVIEIINGMQDIKLHNAEKRKRWNWEFTQARLYKVAVEGLALEQYQSVGSGFINELKNIFITVLSATLVISGDITLGMMLAISYIVGQLNAPIGQLIGFIKEWQDAKISLERLGEIHNKEDEESDPAQKISDYSTDEDISLENLSYRYIGSEQLVLQELNLTIPANKVTAIVGVSGSGKTTLMKMLLKFYEPLAGRIKVGQHNLKNISQSAWRESCGVVLQEGYIFNDSIAHNIAVGDDYIDKKKLAHAIDVANIKEYIESLPLSYNTQIGMEGIGLSTGQKQRLLIARAVYKNPDFLFFDEATSALDANNEKVIMDKLNIFFKNKTVLVIAHRLSTVKNADQIVVLDQGKIAEQGTHESLIALKGDYYRLVKNQLELGS